ncbi:MAG: PAS domain-containing sensor histidine kinase [Pseudomonadota bacterium]
MVQRPAVREFEEIEAVLTGPRPVRLDRTALSCLRQLGFDHLWVIDLDLPEASWISLAARRRFGLEGLPRGAQYHTCVERIVLEDFESFIQATEAHLAAPSRPVDCQLRIRDRSGRLVWFRCRGVAVRGTTPGRARRILCLLEDQSAQRAIETLRTAETRRLNEAREDLARFAYALSHDLKAPTNTLELLCNEISEMLSPDEDADVHDMVTEAQRVIGNMQGLINDVAAFADLHGSASDPVRVALSDLAAEAVSVLSRQIVDVGATIRIGALPTIVGDRAQLRRLFIDLIGNALQNARDDAQLSVTVRTISPDRPGLRGIEIIDTGKGIPPESIDEMFRVFKRMEPGQAGSGLGLPLCRRIAANHGGFLGAHSVPGQGTHVTVWLRAEGV